MTVPTQGSKYNMESAPPYQVSFQQSSSGKLLPGSKRRVSFNFGFADPKALADGASGPDARGEEHEINLVWSVASGKRTVTMDGQEVHFSQGKSMENRFETCWSLNGCHTLKLVAHSAHPLFHPLGFRPFDLFLDGLSFWKMPRIYELGVSNDGQPRDQPVVQSPSFKRTTEHGFALPASQESSPSYNYPASSKRSMESPTAVTDVAALNPPTPKQTPRATAVDLMDSVSPPDLHRHTNSDNFAPVEHTAATPSFALVANQVMSAYGPPATSTPAYQQDAIVAVAPRMNEPYHPQQQPFVPSTPPSYHNPGYSPQQQQPQPTHFAAPPNHYAAPFQPMVTPSPHQHNAYQQPPAEFVPHPTTPPAPFAYQEPPHAVDDSFQAPPEDTTSPFPLTMAPLSLEDIKSHEAPSSSPMEKAVHSLVNLDDLNETFTSPQQRKFAEKKQTLEPIRSKPRPPPVADWKLGLQPKLSDIQQHAGPKEAPRKEVMRTHAFDPAAAQAGMMVTYGSAPAPGGFARGFAGGYYPAQAQMY